MAALKQQILASLVTEFETDRTATGSDEGYTIKWSEVTRKPIEQLSTGRAAVMGVYGPKTPRTTTATGEMVTAVMQCVLEMHVNRDVGALEDLLGQAIAEAEKRLIAWGDASELVMRVDITDDEEDLDGQYDNFGACALYAEVSFRYRRGDPFAEPD